MLSVALAGPSRPGGSARSLLGRTTTRGHASMFAVVPKRQRSMSFSKIRSGVLGV